MRITDVRTWLVGHNLWEELFVRVDTDEGIHGVGEGTLNALTRTVRAPPSRSCAPSTSGSTPPRWSCSSSAWSATPTARAASST
ncbi:MAG: hypothetical protein R3C32_03680 [Chloroflexota bacterium]